MSLMWKGYRQIVVEPYRGAVGHRGDVHIRPSKYQVIDGELLPTHINIQCPKALHSEECLGKKFKIEAAWKKNRGTLHLFSKRYAEFSEVRREKFKFVIYGSRFTRDELLGGIHAYNDGFAHSFGPSKKYDLLHEGRRYPPKAIVGIAAELRSGNRYGPKSFTGGSDTACFRMLEAAGFAIVRKAEANPFEVEAAKTFVEGAIETVAVNRYERDEKARQACVEHFGPRCIACGFDFGEKYGPLGDGYIQVHHILPLSQIRKQYKVDPIKDLRPVCANCHAMIHRSRQVLTVEQLTSLIRKPSASVS